ncbi:MAG: helix-turn-helix transcriptional regulator [Oscillospiraceae bacterium]|nr:helix-turn-helix transcriptional regulator [Oscillospiraceae bacterium]
MRKYSLFSRHSIPSVWMISYVVISLITVFFNFIAYVKIDGNVTEQNERYVGEMLENRKMDIDNFTNLVSNVAIEISQRQTVRKLAFTNDELKNEKLMMVHDVLNDLDVYKKLENVFDNIYIYFYNTDYCVSMTNANTADSYYDVNISEYGITKAEWLKIMQEKQGGQYTVFSSDAKDTITYFYSVYSVERFVPFATIAIEADVSKLLNSSSNPSYNGNFYICTEDDTIIGDDAAKLNNVKKMVDKYGVKSGVRDFKENMTMICTDSESNNWKYFYLVDNSVFKKLITSARTDIAVYNLIGILIMFLVAKFLVNFNYNPIRKIIDAIGGNHNAEVSEYQLIEDKITSVMRENSEVNHRIKSFDSDFVREALITRLLTETSSETEKKKILETLANVGIVFPFNRFAVLLIYIDINLDMFFDGENDAEEDYRLARVALINIMDEVFAGECKINYCDLNGLFCCIANLKDDQATEDVVKKLHWVKKLVLENFNINFAVGISNTYSNIDDLGVCFAEASSCMKERLYNSKGIICYSDLEKKNHTEYCLPAIKEGQILEYLYNGNSKAAINTLDGLFNEKIINKIGSFYSMKSILYNLIIIINRAFSQTGDEMNGKITEILEQIDKLKNKADVEALQKNIYSVIEYGCAQNGKEITNRIDVLMKKAKEYVDDNYMDINLSVTAVAQNIDVSLQYLSTNFKKNYKIGLAEYITLVRIDHAKELLTETNIPIADIAEKVGYVNSRSFFRSFMRIVGTSPKGYRTSESK